MRKVNNAIDSESTKKERSLSYPDKTALVYIVNGSCRPVRIHHFATQSIHSVDRAGWQAKMASIEFWIPWRNVHRPHCHPTHCRDSLCCMRRSHLSPVNCLRHRHMKVCPRRRHCPPFWHGCEAQGSRQEESKHDLYILLALRWVLSSEKLQTFVCIDYFWKFHIEHESLMVHLQVTSFSNRYRHTVCRRTWFQANLWRGVL